MFEIDFVILLLLLSCNYLDAYTQSQLKLIGTGASGNAYQGSSTAVSGDGLTVCVGGQSDNSNTGAIWFYTRANAGTFTWMQQGSKIVPNDSTGSPVNFGWSCSLSFYGSIAVVGGFNDNGGIGATWIITRDSSGVWAQQGSKRVGTGYVSVPTVCLQTNCVYQGCSISIASTAANVFVTGGYFDNSEAGAAWVFSFSGGVWSQVGNKLVGSGGSSGALQGSGVAISANAVTIAVGGPWDSNGGSVWKFTLSGSSYLQQGGKFTASPASLYFGHSVALSADGATLVVGADQDGGNIGAMYVFTRSVAGVWSQVGGKNVGTNYIGTSIRQGISVAISANGNIAAVGGNDDNSGIGATWIFTRDINNIWLQYGPKLVGSGYSGTSIYQGSSISLSADGSILFVGGNSDNSYVGAAWAFNDTLFGCQQLLACINRISPSHIFSGGLTTISLYGINLPSLSFVLIDFSNNIIAPCSTSLTTNIYSGSCLLNLDNSNVNGTFYFTSLPVGSYAFLNITVYKPPVVEMILTATTSSPNLIISDFVNIIVVLNDNLTNDIIMILQFNGTSAVFQSSAITQSNATYVFTVPALPLSSASMVVPITLLFTSVNLQVSNFQFSSFNETALYVYNAPPLSTVLPHGFPPATTTSLTLTGSNFAVNSAVFRCVLNNALFFVPDSVTSTQAICTVIWQGASGIAIPVTVTNTGLMINAANPPQFVSINTPAASNSSTPSITFLSFSSIRTQVPTTIVIQGSNFNSQNASDINCILAHQYTTQAVAISPTNVTCEFTWPQTTYGFNADISIGNPALSNSIQVLILPPCSIAKPNSLLVANTGACECPIGTQDTSTVCSACAVGFYQDLLGQTFCKPCPNLMDTNGTTGATTIAACLCKPSFVLNPSTAACSCPPGFFYDPSIPVCSPCPANTFHNDYNLNATCVSCTSLALGSQAITINNMVGSVSENLCVCPSSMVIDPSTGQCLCAPGYFYSPSTQICSICPPGAYSTSYGLLTSCNPCPNFEDTSGVVGATSFSQCVCQPRYWLNPRYNSQSFASSRCLACLNGMDCPGNNTAIILPGYWRSNPNSTFVLACPGGTQSCPGSLASSTTLCSSSTHGPLCNVCSNGYAKLGSECTICPPAGANDFVVLLLALLAIILIGALIYSYSSAAATASTSSSSTSNTPSLATILKITLNYLQILFYIGRLDAHWSQGSSAFYIIIGTATLTASFFNIDCAAHMTYFDKLVLIYISPLIVVVVLSCVYAILHIVRRKTMKQTINDSQLAIMVVLYQIHPTIMLQVITSLSCDSIPGTGTSYLKADMSVDCSSSAYKSYFAASIFYLVFYIFGMMVLLVIRGLMHNAKTGKLFDRSHNAHYKYSFFFAGYDEHSYYWEAVIMSRKLIIAGLSILASSGLQLVWSGIVIIVSFVATKDKKPFENEFLNRLEMTTLVVLYATVVLGFHFLLIDSSDIWVTVLFIFINSVMILYCLFNLFRVAAATHKFKSLTRSSRATKNNQNVITTAKEMNSL